MSTDRRLWILLALLVAVACRVQSKLELACLANDPSVDPARCYAAARAEAYDYGAAWGESDGYDAGYAQCESDLDTGGGDTGDTGDTGS